MTKLSKKQTRVIGVIIIVTWVIGSILFSLYVLPNFPETSKDQKTFIFALAFSLFSFVFIIMKKKGLNKYSLESFELLFIMVIPTMAAFPLLLEPRIHIVFFLLIYPTVVISWLFLSKYMIVGDLSIKKEKDIEEKTKALSAIKSMWGYLMALLIPIFALYLGVVFPFYINAPP